MKPGRPTLVLHTNDGSWAGGYVWYLEDAEGKHYAGRDHEGFYIRMGSDWVPDAGDTMESNGRTLVGRFEGRDFSRRDADVVRPAAVEVVREDCSEGAGSS